MEGAKRVALVAEPDAYFRIALEAILKKRLGFSTVLEATSLDEAHEWLAQRTDFNLALFELSMPGMRGAESLAAVRDCFAQLRVVVVAGSTRKQDILMSLHAGVHGYVPKNASPDELTTALRMVIDGMIYVPPSVASTPSVVLDEPRLERPFVGDGALDDLTPRQREVLELLIQGKSNKEIARDLRLGEGTVKIHMAGLFRALGVTTRAAAAAAGTQLLYR